MTTPTPHQPIRRPAELILTTAIYDVLRLTPPGQAGVEAVTVAEIVARHQLCQIAHNAELSVVFEALLAIGGPADSRDITEQVRAIRERAAGNSGRPSP